MLLETDQNHETKPDMVVMFKYLAEIGILQPNCFWQNAAVSFAVPAPKSERQISKGLTKQPSFTTGAAGAAIKHVERNKNQELGNVSQVHTYENY